MNYYAFRTIALAMVISCSALLATRVVANEAKPNILIITVDDMSCDSVGVFGCKLPGTTPNIDALASQGLRYQHAHVQTGSCYPSRNVMFSGRYSHNTGVEGFYQVRETDYPHLVDSMKSAGYFVGIRGKVSHSTPYQPYAWDNDLTTLDGRKQDMKNPRSYYASTKRGIEMAGEAGKPFCLNVNISDPHKPFYAMGKKGEVIADKNVPTHIFTPEEVPIPGFLFDHPDVRKELAHYYSSVRRADDCLAEILKALDESGQKDNTVVMFFSDHGMPFPFAKTAVWHHSTHTPWIVRWPGVTTAGAVDTSHMISAVDLMPTLMDIAGAAHPEGYDGKSFLPTIRGESQAGRDMVYKFHNENSGRNRSPMRSVETKKYGYLFNPWSDGKRVFKTATSGTMAFRAMQKLAPTDETIAARLDLFQHGTLEEFYDYENDPDALNNLINDPNHAQVIDEHRAMMRKTMVESSDPLLEVFDKRNDDGFRSQAIDKLQAQADARRAKERKGKNQKGKKAGKKANSAKTNQKLFSLTLPKSASPGGEFLVTVDHKLSAELGEQKFHVTIKNGNGERVDRIVKSASGTGQMTVTFNIAADFDSDSIRVSVFVGEDYPSSLLHLTQGPIKVAQAVQE